MRQRLPKAALAAAALLALAACGEGGTLAETAETEARAEAASAPAAVIGEHDMVLGRADAPVTVIEYASVTCPHCAQFHETAFKELKAQYIDTGLVRFVFREFPTSPAELSMAGFLLARCAGKERYFLVVDGLFRRQNDWVYAQDAGHREATFLNIARQIGMTGEQVDACLRDEAMRARIDGITREGAALFGIRSTPSLVIEGRRYQGELTFAAIEEAIRAHLPTP